MGEAADAFLRPVLCAAGPALLACNPPSLPALFSTHTHAQFGEVLEGIELVKTIESKGSQSGKTNVDIVIKASGELPMEAASA